MPLTPDDVQNKEFLTVRLREGYDMQEVDQFLDEVETELRRLYEENERLRAQLSQAAQSPGEGGAAVSAATAAGMTETGVQRAISDPAQAPQAALKILTHAQRTADDLVDDARAQSEAMVSSAMAEAERVRTESEAAAEKLRNESTSEAERLRTESEAAAEKLHSDSTSEAERLHAASTAEAERLVREAHERAAALDTETENRRAEMFGELELGQSKLQEKVDELRAHEREYRSRLTAYHEAQVRKLRSGEMDDLEPSALPPG